MPSCAPLSVRGPCERSAGRDDGVKREKWKGKMTPVLLAQPIQGMIDLVGRSVREQEAHALAVVRAADSLGERGRDIHDSQLRA